MAPLPLLRPPSFLLRASIKPPLLCFTASASTLSFHFLNPCTISNAKLLHVVNTSLSSSVAEAEAEPTALEEEQKPKNRLIAQNVPWDCTGDDIKALFEKHGTVVDVELSMYNKVRNRGLAFITMASVEEAVTALNNINGTELAGRKINVQFAKSQKKQPVGLVPEGQGTNYPVFVGNLSFKVKAKDLREFFSTVGNVVSAEIIYHSKPRRSAGYGFVSFYSKEEAEVAIATFNGKELMGRPVRVGSATEKPPKKGEIDGNSTENNTSINQEKIEDKTSVSEE